MVTVKAPTTRPGGRHAMKQRSGKLKPPPTLNGWRVPVGFLEWARTLPRKAEAA